MNSKSSLIVSNSMSSSCVELITTFASFKRDKKRLPTHSEKLKNRLTDALNLACMNLLLVKVVKHLKHIPQSSEYFYTSLQNFSIRSAGDKQEAIICISGCSSL